MKSALGSSDQQGRSNMTKLFRLSSLFEFGCWGAETSRIRLVEGRRCSMRPSRKVQPWLRG